VKAALALALVLLSPLAFPVGWDSYPISSYPMFSRGDLGDRLALTHAVHVDAEGRRRPVPPVHVGSAEPMIAMTMLARAVAEGRAGDLCRAIAARGPEGTIEIAWSVYDTKAYFAGDRAPRENVVHARCRR